VDGSVVLTLRISAHLVRGLGATDLFAYSG